MKNILISAGEASGDTHAANLVKDLKELNPGLNFFGIGCEKMQEQGVDLIERMDKLSIVGVWEALVNFKKVYAIYKKLMARVKNTVPVLAILVDYPGFNLKLAKDLKKMGVKVVYYITPQVWAWGNFRVRAIKKYVDKAIVIFKFEEDFFKKYGIDASFVGHPLLDAGRGEGAGRKALGLDEKKTTIALLPGSRESEIKKILPLMLDTAGIILKEKDTQFVLLKTSAVSEDIYGEVLKGASIPLIVIKDDTHGCLSVSDFVFTASGTATLENAIMEKPMLITYKTSLFTFLLGRIFVRTPKFGNTFASIGLVNIVAGEPVSPEIIQCEAKPERLAGEILSIISSEEKMEKQISGLRRVKSSLGAPGASRRTARIINDFITRQR